VNNLPCQGQIVLYTYAVNEHAPNFTRTVAAIVVNAHDEYTVNLRLFADGIAAGAEYKPNVATERKRETPADAYWKPLESEHGEG
jgi:hypothetical protein